MEFLKFINKELERLDCVEYLECPDILNVLVELSEVLKIDINIYSQQGMLVATSPVKADQETGTVIIGEFFSFLKTVSSGR